jgi:hypothetical protein
VALRGRRLNPALVFPRCILATEIGLPSHRRIRTVSSSNYRCWTPPWRVEATTPLRTMGWYYVTYSSALFLFLQLPLLQRDLASCLVEEWNFVIGNKGAVLLQLCIRFLLGFPSFCALYSLYNFVDFKMVFNIYLTADHTTHALLFKCIYTHRLTRKIEQQ